MQVVEGRNKQLVAKVNHLTSPIHVFRQLLVNAFYQAIGTHNNVAVFNDFQLTRRRGKHNVRFVDFHGVSCFGCSSFVGSFLKKMRQIR